MAILFDIGFRLSGKDLQSQIAPSLSKISEEIDMAFQKGAASGAGLTKPIQEAVTAANALGAALERAQTNKGLSFTEMNKSLRASGTTVEALVAKLGTAGPAFSQSFNLALTSLSSANRQVTILGSKLAEAGRVFTQSLKFTTAQTAIRFLTGSIQQSIGWVKDLDSTLTNISVVTGKTGDQLEKVYSNIIQGASDLRVAAAEYGEASVIFYQQGLNDAEVARRTEITIQAAKAAGQSVETMASQLTAIWNSYKMVGEEQQRAASVGAALAAQTAVDFKDIAEAMQIAAAGAAQMGVSYDSLAAIIATVGDNTQQSASIIGNAYKTIFSRFQQLTTEGTDGEVTLNSVSSKLQALGIQIMDSSGKLKNMEQIIYDVGISWDSYSKEQQLAIAQIAGGTRQYGQLLSLFQNFPKYLDNLNIASQETGATLVQQFLAARSSIESTAEMAKEAWQKAFGQIFKADGMKELYQMSEKVANSVGNIIKYLGGVTGILTTIGFVFQKQIAEKITNASIQLKDMWNYRSYDSSRNAISVENKKTESAFDENAKTYGNSLDNDAAKLKLEEANKLKLVYQDINLLISKGNEESKIQGQTLAATVGNAQNRLNSTVDTINSMQHGMAEVNKELKAENNILAAIKDDRAFLNDEQKAELAVLQEKADLLNAEMPARQFELQALSTRAELDKAEIERQREKYALKQQEVIVQQELLRQQLEAEQHKEKPNTDAIASLEQQIAALGSVRRHYKDLEKGATSSIKGIDREIGKLNQSFRDFKSNAEAAAKAAKELRDGGKATKELTILTNNAAKAFNELSIVIGKSMINNKGVFDTQEGQRNIDAFINKFGQIPGVTAEVKQKLQDAFTSADVNGANSYSQYVERIAAAIRTFNADENNKIKINIDEKTLVQMGLQGEQLKNVLHQLGLTAEDANAKFKGMTTSMQTGLQQFVSGTMSILQMGRALDSLTSMAIDGKLSFTGLLTSLVTLLPAFITLNKAISESQILSKIDATFKAAQAAATGGLGVASGAAAVAVKGLKAAIDFATMGITAIISAIIAAVTALMLLVKWNEKQVQQRREEAEAARESAAAMKENADAIQEQNDLFNEGYEELNKAVKGTTEYAEAQKKISDAVNDTLSQLESFGAKIDDDTKKMLEQKLVLAELTGDYNDLRDAMNEVTQIALEQSINESEGAKKKSEATFVDSMKDGVGHVIGDTYSANIGGGLTKGDEKKAIDTMKKGGYETITTNGRNGLTISTDNSAEGMIKAYEEALRLQAELQKEMSATELAESEVYQNLTDWLDKSAEAYQMVSDSQSELNEQALELLNLSPEAFIETIDKNASSDKKMTDEEKQTNIDALTIPEGGFTDLTSYEEYKAKLLEIAEAAGIGEEAVQSFLTTNENSMVMEQASQRVQQQKDAYKELYDAVAAKDEDELTAKEKIILETTPEEMNAQIDAFVKDLDEEELTQYLKVEPDFTDYEKSMESGMRRQKDAQVLAQNDAVIQGEDYKKQNDIVSGLETGGTLSPEDFNALNDAYKGFFTEMEDGTYQLVQNAEKLKDTVEQTHQEELLDAVKSSIEKAGEYQQIISSGQGTSEDREMYNDFVSQSVAAQETFLMTSDSLTELDTLWGQLKTTVDEGVLSYSAYAQALTSLGLQYENCAKEVADYEAALRGGDQASIRAAEEALRASVLIGESAEKYGISADVAEAQSKELAKAYGLSAEQAAKAAVNNQRLNKGMSSLNSNFKDWKKTLTTVDKTSQDYAEAVVGVTDSVKDLIGATDDFELPEGFLDSAENLDLLEQAANGSQDAVNQLGLAIATSQISSLEMSEQFAKQMNGYYEEFVMGEGYVNNAATIFESYKSTVLGGLETIQGKLGEIEAGASLADVLGGEEAATEWITALNEMAIATGMSVEQMNSLLSEVGLTADVTTTPVTQDVDVPSYIEKVEGVGYYETQMPAGYDEDGNVKYATVQYPKIQKWTEPGETKTYTETIEVAQIGTNGNKPGPANVSYTGTAGGNASGKSPKASGTSGGNKGGGGGSKGSTTPVKKVKKTQKEDKERYTDNKNAIEDLSTSIDRLSKSTDRAFGGQKIRNINLANSLLAKQAERYQILYKEAKNYQKLDAQAINSGLSQFNKKWGTDLKAIFDDDFLMDNEMEIRNKITDLVNQKIEGINAIEDELRSLADQGVMSDDPRVESLEKQLESLQEVVDELNTDSENLIKKNIENYQEAIKEANDAIDAIADLLRQALDQEIEKYTVARDLHLQINDLEQRHWRAIMDNMGEVGKLGKQTAKMLEDSLESIKDSINRHVTHYQEMGDVQERWANRDITLKTSFNISDEAWDQAMKDGKVPQAIMDAFQEDIDALMDLRQQVWDNLDEQWQNYIDSIQFYIDEYDRITSKLDSQMAISDHLLSVIQTVGFNYKWGDDKNSAQYKNMSKQLEAVAAKAKAVNGELALVTNRRKEAEEEMNKLLAGRSYKAFADSANEAEMFEFNRIKEHYDEMSELETQLNEERIALLDEAYQKATEYAQQWADVISHEMDEALEGLFDTLDEAMDMYNQKRDIDTFFMDEYDKVFELNKLQKEINDVLDDLSDPDQLSRYNDLLAEIEEKKAAGVKMTEKDLEILRAQFDLEMARDAYEDQRNMKTTMRLTRDASGNYSYVYSDDESNIEDKEAKIEEALHNIYKLNREAADEYSETWLQLQVDWQNYIKSIDQARYKQDAEYRDMVNQRMEWYAQQSDLLAGEIIKHNDAIGRNFEDTTLGVITDMDDMQAANERYKENHSELKDKLIENYQEWIDKADETMREVGGSMSDLESVVDDETTKMMNEVDDLKDTIDELNWQAQSALGELEGFIQGWVASVNSEFETTIATIDALIEKYLEMLRVMAQEADTAKDFDPTIDYAAKYLDAIDRGDYEEAEKWFNMREYKMEHYQGQYPENAASQEALKDIGSIWNTDRELAQSALDIIQHGNKPWTRDDVDIGTVINSVNKVDSSLNNLTGALTDEREQKKNDIGWDDATQSFKKTASGGLITTPQVRSLAEEGPELVLNAEDTQNILAAVKAIRGTVQAQIGAAELGFIAKTGRVADITPYIPPAQTDSIDQTVHIEASFPGVSVAAEIETALNGLIVQAAQHNFTKRQ